MYLSWRILLSVIIGWPDRGATQSHADNCKRRAEPRRVMTWPFENRLRKPFPIEGHKHAILLKFNLGAYLLDLSLSPLWCNIVDREGTYAFSFVRTCLSCFFSSPFPLTLVPVFPCPVPWQGPFNQSRFALSPWSLVLSLHYYYVFRIDF